MTSTQQLGSIQNKIDFKDVVFENTMRGRIQHPYVSFTASNCNLYFNPLMIEKLKIEKWENVIVGYDKKTHIIIIKNSSVEEFGCIRFRTRPRFGKYKNTPLGKFIGIHHINKALNLFEKTYFNAEVNKENTMIFLEKIEK
jgi:hypothetical protein